MHLITVVATYPVIERPRQSTLAGMSSTICYDSEFNNAADIVHQLHPVSQYWTDNLCSSGHGYVQVLHLGSTRICNPYYVYATVGQHSELPCSLHRPIVSTFSEAAGQCTGSFVPHGMPSDDTSTNWPSTVPASSLASNQLQSMGYPN